MKPAAARQAMTEPRNIAMLALHSSPIGRLGTGDTGGMSVYLLELATALGRRGHRVDIFTRELAREADTVTDYGANVRIIGLFVCGTGHLVKDELYDSLDRFSRSIERFRRADRAGYQLIHSNYWLSGVVGDRLRETWRCPHLISFHTMAAAKVAARQGHRENRRRIDEENRLLRRCDGVLVATAAERDRLAAALGPKQAVPYLVPLGVDLDRFAPVPADRARPRQRPPAILFVGRFDPMKGVEDAVTAFARLQMHPAPELLLVGGDGPESSARRPLEELARTLRVLDRISFIGPVEHRAMPAWYRRADLVVAPSYYESFGLVVLEALAAGTPVAATPTGVAATVITPGENGYLTPAGDPVCLARAMADGLALAARQDPRRISRSVSGHDWARVADLTDSAYSGALSRR